MKKDVVIIGAGAAGLMCALTAGRRRRSVLVLEHMEKIANKVRVSGGGRCNFTNLNASSNNYISRNPSFCKSALARFTPYDFIGMIEKHGVGYYEKEDGQLFCKRSSGEIIDLLYKECSQAGVEIQPGCRIESIKKKNRFIIAANHGAVESQSLVVAAGGLSYPKLGATERGYGIARQFGLNVTPLRPALVPLVFEKKEMNDFCGLSGVSLNTIVSCGKVSFDGNILFTHRGLSGPAILQISLYWEAGMPITINLMPGTDVHALFTAKRQSRMKIENLLSEYLPMSFAKKWCELFIRSKPVNQYSEKELREIAYKLQNWQIIPHGTEGYEKAEVTLGGVDTDELSSRTMEAKKAPGLYFIGEVVDVTGQLGGFNLQWAWSSGYAAGQYA
ncbi:MAG: NAD(P)/FAD-dependent oxidoreductase [Nitrospirae bacterium]|nr:NAD(P)/FAD-dependent oxidoreductase [Nitrospirota bacterium]